MTWLASVLRSPQLGDRRLVDPSADPVPDPRWLERLATAEAAAYRRGLEDGRRLAVAETEAQLAATREALMGAMENLIQAVHRAREEQAEDSAARVLHLARRVAGRLPADPDELCARVRAVVALLDEPQLVVRVHPALAPPVAEALAGDARLDVRADPELAPGEARVEGMWSGADLCDEAVWAAVAEALDVG